MTSPAEEITIRCPRCRREFKSWWRASINLKLEHFDKKYLEEACLKKCPHCGQQIELGMLIVDEEGVFHLTGNQPPLADEE